MLKMKLQPDATHKIVWEGTRRCRYLGTAIARAIVAGDVDRARRLACLRTTWNVPEARAIAAACRVARERFAGCSVSFSEFL